MLDLFCSLNGFKWILKAKQQLLTCCTLRKSLTWLDKHAMAAGMIGVIASQILPEPARPSLSLKLILLNPACGGLCEQRFLVIECPQITGSIVACLQKVSLLRPKQQHLQDIFPFENDFKPHPLNAKTHFFPPSVRMYVKLKYKPVAFTIRLARMVP